MEGVTIRSQPGMGIVGFDSRDIFIRGLAVVPAPGDSIEIVNVSTLEAVATVTVYDVLHEESSRDVKVKYNGVLPPAISDCYAFNISKLPRLVFRNNVVLGNLARGVLVKTRDVVVEGNIFKGCTGTAVHVGAESDWKEGTFSKNVLITRNVMVNCGLGAGRQVDASGIAVLADAPALEGILLHENIDIHDNVIIGNGENVVGICVEHASGVSLYNNTVIGCSRPYSMTDVERLME